MQNGWPHVEHSVHPRYQRKTNPRTCFVRSTGRSVVNGQLSSNFKFAGHWQQPRGRHSGSSHSWSGHHQRRHGQHFIIFFSCDYRFMDRPEDLWITSWLKTARLTVTWMESEAKVRSEKFGTSFARGACSRNLVELLAAEAVYSRRPQLEDCIKRVCFIPFSLGLGVVKSKGGTLLLRTAADDSNCGKCPASALCKSATSLSQLNGVRHHLMG